MLQVTLLRRSNKGTYPTEYGLRVYQDCKEILRSLEEKITSWQSFAEDKEKIAGSVHLAAIPVACNFILESIIGGIQERYPEIEIFLHEVPMDDFAQGCLRSGYNIGLTAVMLSQKDAVEKQYHSLKLDYQTLLTDEYQIYLSTKHPYARKDYLTEADCRHLDMVTYSTPLNRKDFQHWFNLPVQRLRYLNSLGNILQVVAENQGQAVFLYQMLRNNWYIKNGFICAKPIKERILCPSEHHLVWADEVILTGAEKAVIAFIREHYAHFYAMSPQYANPSE